MIFYTPPTEKDIRIRKSGGEWQLCWGELRINIGKTETEAQNTIQNVVDAAKDLVRNKPSDCDGIWDLGGDDDGR
jgi:hypothetical protein